MPGCDGRTGGVGFCLGGTLAYVFAATARVDGTGPDAVVSYYGSGINDMLGMADQIECPILFHYGERDPFIPAEQIDAVEQAMAGHADVTVAPLRRRARLLQLGRAVDVRRDGRGRGLGPHARFPRPAPAVATQGAVNRRTQRRWPGVSTARGR